MIKTMEKKVRKVRYISLHNDGLEMYTEPISIEGDIRDYIPAGKLRLREIKKVMPLGKWGMNVEEQWKGCNDDTHFLIVDVETGEVKEQVL